MYFPKTRIDEFKKIKKKPHLRTGQQFYEFMKLEKVSGIDKIMCDKIYETKTFEDLQELINPYIDLHN